MSDTGVTDASRALVGFLGAIILGESLQGTIAEKYGVRLAEFRALGAVQRAGLVPISHFAELVGTGRSTATGVIDRLEEAALVERVLDRSDLRVVKVRATARVPPRCKAVRSSPMARSASGSRRSRSTGRASWPNSSNW